MKHCIYLNGAYMFIFSFSQSQDGAGGGEVGHVEEGAGVGQVEGVEAHEDVQEEEWDSFCLVSTSNYIITKGCIQKKGSRGGGGILFFL